MEKEHHESLIPALPTPNFIPDGNHCFWRLTEHMGFIAAAAAAVMPRFRKPTKHGPRCKGLDLGPFLCQPSMHMEFQKEISVALPLKKIGASYSQWQACRDLFSYN